MGRLTIRDVKQVVTVAFTGLKQMAMIYRVSPKYVDSVQLAISYAKVKLCNYVH